MWPDGVAVPADAHGPWVEGRRPCGAACHELMRCEQGERRLRGFPSRMSLRVQQITAAVSLVFRGQRATVHAWSWNGWVDRLAGWCDTVRSGRLRPPSADRQGACDGVMVSDPQGYSPSENGLRRLRVVSDERPAGGVMTTDHHSMDGRSPRGEHSGGSMSQCEVWWHDG